MSKNLEKRVASILWSTVLVVVFASAVWMGIGIGRSGEKQRMQQLMAMQAENDGGICSMVPMNPFSVSSTNSRVMCSVG